MVKVFENIPLTSTQRNKKLHKKQHLGDLHAPNLPMSNIWLEIFKFVICLAMISVDGKAKACVV